MNDKPTSIRPGGKYRLWLQFVGGEASIFDNGRVMPHLEAVAIRDEYLAALLDGQAGALTSHMDNVWIIQHLQPDDVTARVWVSEA